ncbi:MAG: DUF3800 domain-containing protein [Nitrosospira sp.]
MNKILNFYMDDSGTRQPDKSKSKQERNFDWFALGGILIAENDEEQARREYASFRDQWKISYPLHSYDIRNHARDFQWLSQLRQFDKHKYAEFYTSLQTLLLNLPVMGLACVVDRPGYNHRYQTTFGRGRWSLCKTAFTIAVERAAKYAMKRGMRLRVMAERCNVKEDEWLTKYYGDLKVSAAPFNSVTSAQYMPLSPQNFADILYEFKLKKKSSPLIQIADMYLWPICMGGYDETNLPYQALTKANRLVGLSIGKEEADLGIKYSCFDLVKRKQLP